MKPPPKDVSAPGPGVAPLGKVGVVVVLAVGISGFDVPPTVFAAAGLLVVLDAVLACVLFRPVPMQAMVPPVASTHTVGRTRAFG